MHEATRNTFTDRQVQVVRLIAHGFSNEEAALELPGDALAPLLGLHVSSRTVKAHCDVLRSKLGVEKRRQIPEAYLNRTGDDPYPRAAALEAVA